MLIAINGDIIDSNHIYMVTEVKKTLKTCSFKIKFFNGKELEISLSIYELYKKDNNIEDSSKEGWEAWDSIEYRKRIEEKIDSVYKDVIECWNGDRGIIKRINL